MLLYGNLGGRSFSKSVVYLREIVLDLLLTMWQWLRRQRARLAMFPSFVPNNSFSRLSLPGRQCWRYSPYSNRSKKIRRWKSFLPEPSRRALLGRPKPDLGSKCSWFYSTGNRSTWTVSFPKNLSIRFGLYSFRQKWFSFLFLPIPLMYGRHRNWHVCFSRCRWTVRCFCRSRDRCVGFRPLLLFVCRNLLDWDYSRRLYTCASCCSTIRYSRRFLRLPNSWSRQGRKTIGPYRSRYNSIRFRLASRLAKR